MCSVIPRTRLGLLQTSALVVRPAFPQMRTVHLLGVAKLALHSHSLGACNRSILWTDSSVYFGFTKTLVGTPAFLCDGNFPLQLVLPVRVGLRWPASEAVSPSVGSRSLAYLSERGGHFHGVECRVLGRILSGSVKWECALRDSAADTLSRIANVGQSPGLVTCLGNRCSGGWDSLRLSRPRLLLGSCERSSLTPPPWGVSQSSPSGRVCTWLTDGHREVGRGTAGRVGFSKSAVF